MIATMDYVAILDRSEELGKMILDSDVMEAYRHSQKELHEDKEAQKLVQAFSSIKEHYEDVQRFGRYHPDYNTIMKEVRKVKREMDMNDKVASFKIAERNLQQLLDEISQYLAYSVSEQIKVPKDGAALSESGCGCGSGGGCGCAV
ncbi:MULTISPECIES: YlbF family regulator [Virgibacillus]|uniref:Regulator n=1 Tax=Virgibacillus pantothenticus TaxID=1473 RepID=A0A0L0QN91_VIRPA|nr:MULTISPECIES: YlbF family regulator [Virgibacillus]API93779.1 regulator [Virgibacillus sp. 6R]KNE20067.1 regulator [Virgibacillus pantothenticus]MBS7429806.1 YlbF family regulator [Virgibacillus sp. 19R1-5]MBU8565100.1 YlbF family regulator [Virgibacillus pantothenticus]MBU8601046.1 YlbF family regulator [Virgibacillus pantothenticus]